MNLEEIGKKSAYSFKKLIKIKSKEYAMDYLLELKSRHTKMENLHYIELKLQDYLNNSEISVQEAKNLYRYRTRVAKFGENMKNNPNISSICPFCKLQPDTQEHSVRCNIVQSKIEVKGSYRDIFLDSIPADITKTLMRITELRENLETK